jgi:hypothetical protein
MRARLFPRFIAKLIAALFCTSGCGPGCFAYIRDLDFRGSTPTEVSGTGADDSAVVEALSALMTNRIYDPNTYTQYGSCGKSNKSRIQNGEVSSYMEGGPIDYMNPDAGKASGNGLGSGSYYTMDFTLPEGPHLSVRFIYNVGQGLLKEVSPESGPVESTSTDLADCNLTGNLAGKAVDLDFKQLLHGVALTDQGY